MDKKILIDKLKAMAASPSCCPELKQAINNYFVALAAEQVAAKNLVAELEEDVVDMDYLTEYKDSPAIIQCFGVEGAKVFAANIDALKAAGAKYCNCKACTIGLEILDNKEVLLS